MHCPNGRSHYTKKVCASKLFCEEGNYLSKSVVTLSIRIFKNLSKLFWRKSQRFGTGFSDNCRDRLRVVGQQSRSSVDNCHYVAKTYFKFFTFTKSLLVVALIFGSLNLSYAQESKTSDTHAPEYYEKLIVQLQKEKRSISCEGLQGLSNIRCVGKIKSIDSKIALAQKQKAHAKTMQRIKAKQHYNSQLEKGNAILKEAIETLEQGNY